MTHIGVLIADDEKVVRDGLVAVVSSEPDLEVVGAARDAPMAIELASRTQPDIAILDVQMPGGGGPRATREILRCSPNTLVLAFSAHDDVDSVLEMLRAGALGYLVKGGAPEEIIEAIHRAMVKRSSPQSAKTRESSSRLSRLWPGRNRSIEGSAAAIPRASGS